jgi:hypothetical protein
MNSQRNQHYNFAYLALPLIAFSDPDALYKKLEKFDKIDFLRKLWVDLGQKYDENIPNDELDCSDVYLEDNQILFIVHLPNPIAQPEAYYVGLLFNLKSGFFSNKAISVRCFNLELSYDFRSKREAYVVGELVEGKRVNHCDHNNYGSIANHDINSFIAAIEDVLSGNKAMHLWTTPSDDISNNESLTPAQDSPTQYTAVEEELKSIWTKWEDHANDEKVKALCANKLEPITNLLIDLGMQCSNLGLFREKDMEMAIIYAIAQLAKGSFMVGLEYPAYLSEMDNFVQQKEFKLLQETARRTKTIAILMLEKLLNKGAISKSKSDSLLNRAVEYQVNAMMECYCIGAELSPKINSSSIQNKQPQELGTSNNTQNTTIQNQILLKDHSDVPFDQLISNLRDPRYRVFAVKTLIEIGDSSNIHIMPLLQDNDPEIRKAILKILTEIENGKSI